MDMGFVPKVLLKVCVKDELLEQAMETIRESAHTGATPMRLRKNAFRSLRPRRR